MTLSFCGAELSIAPFNLARNSEFAPNKLIYMARFLAPITSFGPVWRRGSRWPRVLDDVGKCLLQNGTECILTLPRKSPPELLIVYDV